MTICEFHDCSAAFISDEVKAAWMADPRCLECGELVPSALDAALLVGLNRVAHKERCFAPALVRANPYLNFMTAPRGAKEGQARDQATQSGSAREAQEPRVGGRADETSMGRSE